ncbi:hypothetical protein [Raineyella fluvialis]|uniref:hypothetical protein n=1 Tax=Raineyella fluvialis TaxID=2662261 RepID=UPI00188FC853|nr:hypothetical protein [Raineyella fluvialis]
MSANDRPPRPERARPRPTSGGYAASILINAALYYLINVRPGWQAVPFLTPDTTMVLGIVNASIITTLVANAIYLVADLRWLRALGGVATSAVALVALFAIWRVFPFAFPEGAVDVLGITFDWARLARWILAVGIIGSIIGVIVSVTLFFRGPSSRPRRRPHAGDPEVDQPRS